MKIIKFSLAVAISTAILSTSAMADSWKVTQDVDVSAVGANTTLTQTNTAAAGTSGSVQSLNNINLDTTDGIIDTGSTQTVKAGANTLNLIQAASTDTSKQAANRAVAKTVTDLTQDVQMTAGTIKLDQNAATLATNTQAVNEVNGEVITKLEQKITSTGTTLDMNQEGASTQNTQVGNLLSVGVSTATSGVNQTITVKDVTMDQKSTTSAFQSGNAMLIGDGSAVSGGSLNQKYTTASTLAMTQDGTTSSYQSANYAGVKTNP